MLQIGEKLGNGQFGEVFRAVDQVHGSVAVKIISRNTEESNDDWGVRKSRFLNEAQNLAKATHQNVVRVFHLTASEDGQSVRICMEICEKGSLQSRFDEGPMPLSDIRSIATDVVMGLGALHARGMLHRDIKPGNILLDGRRAKLGDFGLVTDELILGYGSIAGYSDHVAYEVWRGRGTSSKSDIWALGMTFYRLLHGASWYEEDVTIGERAENGGLANGLRWLPHVPKRWRRLIREMLCEDTERRIPTALAVQNRLADLPISPDWTCTVSADSVKWQRDVKLRRQIVEWERRSDKKHKWIARSEPKGKGISRKLDGSVDWVNKAQAIRGLEDFFAGLLS